MKIPKLIASTLCISLALSMAPVAYANEITETKLVGGSRYETAVKVSQKGWSNAEEAILVNSGSIVDALSVTPFAKLINAPILLTDKNTLNSETEKELKRLGVKTVHIIGLNGVISEGVNSKLKSLGFTTNRIGGDDRHLTALDIAEEINKKQLVTEIAIVNGYTGLADAVSIASVAANRGMVILPVSPTAGTSIYDEFIGDRDIEKSYIIGSTNAIPTKIEQSLPKAERLGGIDRNETNAKVINKFFTSNEIDNVFVAKDGMKKQDQLIDALAVGVLAAKENSPVLIVGNNLSQGQKSTFTSKKSKTLTQVGSGGNESAFNELKKLQGLNTDNNNNNGNENTEKVMYVANTETVRARSGPSIDHSVLEELNKGQAVKVVDILESGWVEIEFEEGTAFVLGSYLSTKSPQDNSESIRIKYVNSDTGLNVRVGPSQEDRVLGRLEHGSKIEVVEMFIGGWMKIKYNGSYGFVDGKYLRDIPVNL